MTCTFDGCDRPMAARGLCNSHYAQWRTGKHLHTLGPYTSKVRGDSKHTKRLTILEREGLDEAEADAVQVRIQSGLDMMPRGKTLAEYVAHRLATTDLTAAKIAAQVGYRLDACTQRLAQAGHAALARMLLERHYRDAHTPKPVAVSRGWVPATRYVRANAVKPGPVGGSIDDLVADLLELAELGLTYPEAAAKLGRRTDSLSRRLARRGRIEEIRDAFGSVEWSHPKRVTRIREARAA